VSNREASILDGTFSGYLLYASSKAHNIYVIKFQLSCLL